MLSTSNIIIKRFFKNLKTIGVDYSVFISTINLWILIFKIHLLKDINSLSKYNTLKIK